MSTAIDSFPDNLAGARLALSESHPYLSPLLWSLLPRGVPGMMSKHGAAGPIGVDKLFRLYYDEEVIAKYPPTELIGILLAAVEGVLRATGQCGCPACTNVIKALSLLSQ